MIRKKNLNSKKEEEKERRENEIKEKQRIERERKEQQLELTENLRKTYSHIKPTIIQGQRILKVIFEMYMKIKMLSLIDSPLLEQYLKDEIQLSESLKQYIQDLKNRENEFIDLKIQIDEKIQNLNAYQDEDAGSQENIEEEMSEEQKKLLNEKIELEKKLTQKIGQIQKNVQKISRMICNLKDEKKILQEITDKNQTNKSVQNIIDCVKALKFLFVKKLSTGYDEDQIHNSLLKKLEQNIKQHTIELENKQKELTELKETRKNDNQSKNSEITNLKQELEQLKQLQETEIENLKILSEEKKQKKQSEHKLKKKNLSDMIQQSIEELKEMEKLNLEQEISLQKQNDDTKKRLENLISEYDNSINENQIKFQNIESENQSILDSIAEFEKNCQILKFEKKTNKKFLDVWNEQLQEIEYNEKRKENASKMIINLWKLWKMKNKKKSKKKKKQLILTYLQCLIQILPKMLKIFKVRKTMFCHNLYQTYNKIISVNKKKMILLYNNKLPLNVVVKFKKMIFFVKTLP